MKRLSAELQKVWDSPQKDVRCSLRNFGAKGLICLSFSLKVLSFTDRKKR